MPRPRKRRFVADHPRADYFKPRGVPLNATEEVILPVEGLEALRLADVEGLEQQEAAQHMGVSRPTFSRILAHARGVVSRALVKGWALRIEGGDYQLADERAAAAVEAGAWAGAWAVVVAEAAGGGAAKGAVSV
jgi:predicted DNA-binding protein (UPF0251 family)